MTGTINEKQGIPEGMVLIPEGLFLMGSTKQDIDKLLELDRNIEAVRLDNEIPQREVYLSTYLIDKYSVTNAEYKKLLESKPNIDEVRERYEDANTESICAEFTAMGIPCESMGG